MKEPKFTANEEVVSKIRELLDSKNREIAQLKEKIAYFQGELENSQKEVVSRDRLFSILSDVLNEEDEPQG